MKTEAVHTDGPREESLCANEITFVNALALVVVFFVLELNFDLLLVDRIISLEHQDCFLTLTNHSSFQSKFHQVVCSSISTQ